MQHSEAKSQLLNLNSGSTSHQRPKMAKPPLGVVQQTLNQSETGALDGSTGQNKRQSKWSINIQEIVKRTQRNLERGSSASAGGGIDCQQHHQNTSSHQSGKASAGIIQKSAVFEPKTSTNSSGAPPNRNNVTRSVTQQEKQIGGSMGMGMGTGGETSTLTHNGGWSSLSQNKPNSSGTGLKHQKASGSYMIGKEKSSLLSHDLKKKMNVEQKTANLSHHQNGRSQATAPKTGTVIGAGGNNNTTQSSLGSNFGVRKVESTGGLGAFRSAKSMRPSSAAAQIAAKSLHMANQRSAGGHSTLLDRASLQIARRGEIQQQPQQSIQEALYGQWKSASNAKAQQNQHSRSGHVSGTGAPVIAASNDHPTTQKNTSSLQMLNHPNQEENEKKIGAEIYKIDDFTYQAYGCRTLEQRASSKALQVAIKATSEHDRAEEVDSREGQEEDLEAMIVQDNGRRLKTQTNLPKNTGKKVRQTYQKSSTKNNQDLGGVYLRTDGALREFDGTNQQLKGGQEEGDLLGVTPSLGRRLSQRDSSSIERLQRHLRQQLDNDGDHQIVMLGDVECGETDDRPALSTNNFFTDQAALNNLSKQIKTLRPSSSTEHVIDQRTSSSHHIHHKQPNSIVNHQQQYKLNKTQNSSSQNNTQQQIQYQQMLLQRERGGGGGGVKTAEQVESRLRIFEEEIIKRVKEIQRYVKSLHLQLKRSAGAQDRIKSEIDGDKDILLDLQTSMENQAKRFASDKLKLVTNSELDGRLKDLDQDLSQKFAVVVQQAIDQALTQVRDDLIPNSRFKMYDSISEQSNRLKIELEHQMAQLRKDQDGMSKQLRDSVQDMFKKEAISLRRELKSEVSAENLRINAQVETQIAKALQDAQNDDAAKSELQSLRYELLDEIRVSEERTTLKAGETNRYLRTQIEDQLPQKIQKLQIEVSKQKEHDMKRFVSIDSLGVKLNSLRADLEEISNKQTKQKIDGLKNVFLTQEQFNEQLQKTKKSMTQQIEENLKESQQGDLKQFNNQIETYQLEQEQLICDLSNKIDKSLIRESSNKNSKASELLEEAEKMLKLKFDQKLEHIEVSLEKDFKKNLFDLKDSIQKQINEIELNHQNSKVSQFDARKEIENSVDELRKQVSDMDQIQKDQEFEVERLKSKATDQSDKPSESETFGLISENLSSFKEQTKLRLENLEQRITNKADKLGEYTKIETIVNDLTDDLSQLKLNFSANQKKITSEIAELFSNSKSMKGENLEKISPLDLSQNLQDPKVEAKNSVQMKKLETLEGMVKDLDSKIKNQAKQDEDDIQNTVDQQELQQKIDSSKQKVVDLLKESETNLNSQIERLQKDQKSQNSRLGKLESICDLKVDMSLLFERESCQKIQFEGQIDSIQQNLQNLQKEIRQTSNDLKNFKDNNGPSSSLRNEINDVERKFRGFCEQELQSLALKIKTLSKTKETLVADFEDFKERLDRVENTRQNKIYTQQPQITKNYSDNQSEESSEKSAILQAKPEKQAIEKDLESKQQSIQQLTTDVTLKQGDQMMTKASNLKMGEHYDKSPHNESTFESKSSPQAKSFKIPISQQSLSARPESVQIDTKEVDQLPETQEKAKMHTDRHEIQNVKEEESEPQRQDLDSGDDIDEEPTVNEDEEPSNMVFDSCTEDKSKFMDPSTLDRREAPQPINEIKDPVQFEMANESDIKVQETESSQANLCIQNRMNFLDEQRAREQIVTPSEGNQVANSAEFYNLRREIQSNHIHKKSEMALKVEQSDIESQKLDKSKPLDLDSLPYEEPATETKDKQTAALMRVSGQKKLLCGATALESQDGGHLSHLWLKDDVERNQITTTTTAAHLQTANLQRNEANSSREEEVFRTQKMGGLDQLSQNRVQGNNESDQHLSAEKQQYLLFDGKETDQYPKAGKDCYENAKIDINDVNCEENIPSEEDVFENDESVKSSTDCKNFLKKFEKNASLKRRSGALIGLVEYGQDNVNKLEDEDSALDAILDSANFCNDLNSEMGLKMQNSEQKSLQGKPDQHLPQSSKDIDKNSSDIKVDLQLQQQEKRVQISSNHNRIQSIGTSLGGEADFAPSKALLNMKLAPSFGADEDRSSHQMKDDHISIEGLQLESLANSTELNQEENTAEESKAKSEIQSEKIVEEKSDLQQQQQPTSVDQNEEQLEKALENLIGSEVEQSLLLMIEFGHPNLIVEEDQENIS